MKKIKKVGSRVLQIMAVAGLGLSLVSCGSGNSKELEDLKNQLAEMQETQKYKDEQIKDLNDKLQAEKDKNQTLTSSISSLQTAQTEWEATRANLLSTIENLNAQIKELEDGDGSKAELQAQLEQALSDLALAQEKADEYKTQLGNLPTENAQLKNDIIRLELNIEGYKESVRVWRTEVAMLNTKLKESEESKAEIVAKFKALREDYQTLYSQSQTLNSTIESLNSTIQQLTEENTALKEELEALKNQN